MDWKEYEEKPADGIFASVQRRLRRRRLLRGIASAVVAIVVIAVLFAAVSRGHDVPEEQVAVAETVSVFPEQATTGLSDSRQQEAESGERGAETVNRGALNSRPSTDNSSSVATDTLLPQPRMQLVAVSEPIEEPSFDTSLFTLLSVPSRATDDVKSLGEADTSVGTFSHTVSVGTMQAKIDADPSGADLHDAILWAPNIITPASDNEANRVFKVVATTPVSDFRIHIYNRGGRLLFRSNDIDQPWDATSKGIDMPQGAYVWVATFRSADGASHREAGTVTVVR